MKCPACEKLMDQFCTNTIVFESCTSGCGGIWFDRKEIEHFDEPHEELNQQILSLAANPHPKKRDLKKLLDCPVCQSQQLYRQFFDSKNEVEIDLCWGCGGIWFELGELVQIRKQFTTFADRQKAVNEYVTTVLNSTTEKITAETTARVAEFNEDYKNVFTSFISSFKDILMIK